MMGPKKTIDRDSAFLVQGQGRFTRWGGPNWSSEQANVAGKEPKQTTTRVLTTANLNCHERFTGLSDKCPTEVPRQIDLRSRKPAIHQFTSDPDAWDLVSRADETVDFLP